MIASIVYIFESLFNHMNGVQAIYFCFNDCFRKNRDTLQEIYGFFRI